jgi:uncharacterized BrkB/YihY/UPF0761 family membrane protein
MVKRIPITREYRLAVASRVIAAIVGSFALASAISIALAYVLMRFADMSRAHATATSTVASFLVWCALVMWCFHTASTRRVWLNMLVPTTVLAALAFVLGRGLAVA